METYRLWQIALEKQRIYYDNDTDGFYFYLSIGQRSSEKEKKI